MKGIVTYISQSGKSAIIAVSQKAGKLNKQVSGFYPLSEAVTVGEELDLSMFNHVSSEKREIIDAATGEARTFDFLILN